MMEKEKEKKKKEKTRMKRLILYLLHRHMVNLFGVVQHCMLNVKCKQAYAI